MDATRLANLKAEINNLATFLSTYDSSVSAYLNGTSSTCAHFLESINTLSNDEAASLALEAGWSGHGSAYGALVDFVYEINAIQRNATILSDNKMSYYILDDGQKALDANFNSGESAKTIAYLEGKTSEQNLTT